MTATPALQTATNKPINLPAVGATQWQTGIILGLDNSPVDFSTGWTFKVYMKNGAAATNRYASATDVTSGVTITGLNTGVIQVADAAAHMAENIAVSPATYALYGSTDSFTSQVTIQSGNAVYVSGPLD